MSSTYRRDLWAFCAAAAHRLCSVSWKGTVSPQYHLFERAGGNAEHFPEFHAIKTVNRSSLAYSSSHCNHIIFMQRKLPACLNSKSFVLFNTGWMLPANSAAWISSIFFTTGKIFCGFLTQTTFCNV